MAKVNVYLNFPGNTEEAFNFYKSVFGAEFMHLQRFKDTPDGDKLSAEDQQKIMHVALPVGSNLVLMATDMLESMGQTPKPGNNFTLAIAPGTLEEAHAIFDALSAGGTVHNKLEKAFWGAYWGMFVDKFGIPWMVNYDPNQQQ